MTDVSHGPMHPIWVDVVATVRTLLETFSEGDTLEGLRRSGPLLEDLVNLESHERLPTTYALVALTAATTRWAAMKLDRDEFDVLAEIARGVGVET